MSKSLEQLLRERVEWRPIAGFNDYFVSNSGQIASTKRREAKLIRPYNLNGYLRVNLYAKGATFHRFVHRLVLETFLSPCPKGKQTSHLDGNRGNNNIKNLSWESSAENNLRRINHGTLAIGEKNGKCKLTDDQIKEIRRKYKRTAYRKSNKRQLAKEYGICIRYVTNIIAGKYRAWTK